MAAGFNHPSRGAKLDKNTNTEKYTISQGNYTSPNLDEVGNLTVDTNSPALKLVGNTLCLDSDYVITDDSSKTTYITNAYNHAMFIQSNPASTISGTLNVNETFSSSTKKIKVTTTKGTLTRYAGCSIDENGKCDAFNSDKTAFTPDQLRNDRQYALSNATPPDASFPEIIVKIGDNICKMTPPSKWGCKTVADNNNNSNYRYYRCTETTTRNFPDIVQFEQVSPLAQEVVPKEEHTYSWKDVTSKFSDVENLKSSDTRKHSIYITYNTELNTTTNSSGIPAASSGGSLKENIIYEAYYDLPQDITIQSGDTAEILYCSNVSKMNAYTATWSA